MGIWELAAFLEVSECAGKVKKGGSEAVIPTIPMRLGIGWGMVKTEICGQKKLRGSAAEGQVKANL